MKPYKKYVPSGVNWIGDIPEGWEVKKLKYISHLRTAKTEDSELIYIALEHTESNTGRLLKKDDNESQPDAECLAFHMEDVLFCKLRPYLAKCVLAMFNGKCSSELLVLQSEMKLIPQYLFFTALSHGFLEIVNSSTYGSKMPRANWGFIGNMQLALPDTDTQTGIADYLDHETARLDNIIKIKETLIERLKEKRTALITHAVTKGLDPTAKMKPSGVEWIGDIPEGWEVEKLKYLSSMRSGESISFESILEDGNYAVYGGNGFRGFTDNYTNSGTNILIGRQGALCGNVKVVTGEIWASEHAIVVYYTSKVDPKWYFYMLNNMNLNQYSVSAAQPGLSVEQILKLKACVPPVDTQTAIADYLDTETAKIDITIEKTKLSIEKLKEYRTALISACVTGKIDVRTWITDKEAT